MQEEQRVYNEPRNCGCSGNSGFGGLGSLFGGNCGCGGNSEILFFLIIFLLLFTNCGCNNGCGCGN
ncbi:MAG: hypothetical protein HFJ52_05550 [Clostridia bacterium]|jgi:hypothetical protein|nr:hypothetical protein [Clostridia bacterium]